MGGCLSDWADCWAITGACLPSSTHAPPPLVISQEVGGVRHCQDGGRRGHVYSALNLLFGDPIGDITEVLHVNIYIKGCIFLYL